MRSISEAVAALRGAANEAYGRKWSFLLLFVVAFFLTFALLLALDLVPSSVEPEDPPADPSVTLSASPLIAASAPARVEQPTAASPMATQVALSGELPVTVVIPAIDMSVSVKNPATTDIEKLDQALLSGAVRYPTSASLDQQDGNVVLFGHSSYLPIVHNLAYKTFNGIQNLKKGDLVEVSSGSRLYVYAVTSVEKMNAGDGAIPLAVSGRMLTLSTCDSFGTKSARFVVTASFVESHPLGA